MRLIVNNTDVRKVGEDYEITLPGTTPPIPVPTPTPTPLPTGDPNMEFKGDFSKPDGTTLKEKTGTGPLYVTNGTLMWKGGVWTSNSPTFRMITMSDVFTDVAVSFKARILRFTNVQPQEAWDGMHVFMRYRSQYHLYYASCFRRDQTAALKKKCPGSDTLDGDPHGTYYDYTSVKAPYTVGTWYDVMVRAKNDSSDLMTLSMFINGKLISSYSDNGKFKGKPDICNQIMRGGAVGIRTDNCEWEVKDFTVTSRFPYP